MWPSPWLYRDVGWSFTYLSVLSSELCQANPCRHWCVFLAARPTALALLLCPESVSTSPVQKFLSPTNSSWQRTFMPAATHWRTLMGQSTFEGENEKGLQPQVHFYVTGRQRIHCDFEDCLTVVFGLPPHIYNVYRPRKSLGSRRKAPSSNPSLAGVSSLWSLHVLHVSELGFLQVLQLPPTATCRLGLDELVTLRQLPNVLVCVEWSALFCGFYSSNSLLNESWWVPVMRL